MSTYHNILYNGISGGKVKFLKPCTDKEIKESIERIIQKSKIHAKPYIPPENTEVGLGLIGYQSDEEIAAFVESHCSKSNQSYTWPDTGDNNEPTDYASQQYFPEKCDSDYPIDDYQEGNEDEEEDIEYERQLEQEWIEQASTAAFDYFVDNGLKYKNSDFTGKKAGSYLRRDVEEQDE
jgi:hypothetical protein